MYRYLSELYPCNSTKTVYKANYYAPGSFHIRAIHIIEMVIVTAAVSHFFHTLYNL